MTELEVEPRFPGSFVQFLPSSTPCFSFCNISGIELHLGLLHFIQSLLVTEISEKKTRIGSFWHFFLNACVISVICGWSLMIHFIEFSLFLFQPSGFTLLSARGMSWSSLLCSGWGVGGDFVSEILSAWVQTFSVLWLPCLTEMSDTGVTQPCSGQGISKEANAAQSPAVFWALHCHQCSCALGQHFTADPALRDSKPFPEATGVGIVFPDLKPAIQMALRYI